VSEPTWNPMSQQYVEPKPLTLAEFLLARIDEDEKRTLGARPFDSWEAHEGDYEWDSDALTAGWHTGKCGWRQSEFSEDCGCGVPARMLADCEAKRQVAEECRKYENAEGRYFGGGRNPLTRAIMRALALPYADHPDFRDEWRP
jgi:hypothetical protein